MKFTSTIKVTCKSPKKLFAALESELEREMWDRSSFTIVSKEKHVEIKIIAQDSVALRATQNSITKLLTVYEKLEA